MAWRGTGLVLLITALPLLFVLWVQPDARSIGDASTVAGLAGYPVVLAAAVVLHLTWRHTGELCLSWLSAGLLVAAAQGFSLAGLHVAYGDEVTANPAALLVLAALFCAAVLAALLTTSDAVPVVHPAVVGLLLAVASAIAAAAVPSVDLRSVLDGGARNMLGGAAAALLLVLLVLLTRVLRRLARESVPTWGHRRLVLGFLALVASPLPWLAGSESRLGGLSAIALQLTAVGLLSSLSLALISQLRADSAGELADLRRQVDEVERRDQFHREQLHELNASIAGIVSASRLIHDPSVSLPAERLVQLRHVMESELTRLERMAHGDASSVGDCDLDEVLESVVLAQRIQGRTVECTRTGLRVKTDREYLAEALTTLLNNAARHASGSPVRVTVAHDDTRVSIRVSDFGPGVPPDVAERLFGFGARGASSPGLGIGLAVAQRLMEESGGTLTLVEDTVRGATFEIALPSSEPVRHGAETRSARGAAPASA